MCIGLRDPVVEMSNPRSYNRYIGIRILTPDSIRDSIRTQTADSQVPRKYYHKFVIFW